MIDPIPLQIYNKTKCNQNSSSHHYERHARAPKRGSQNISLLHTPTHPLLTFDWLMLEPIEQVNINKIKMNNHDNSIHILDSIIIILDDVINVDVHASDFDDMYRTINIYHDLQIIIS